MTRINSKQYEIAEQSYTIMISEFQRALLESACGVMFEVQMEIKPTPEQREEYELLAGMLRDLPKAEAETPGCLHGFSL